MLHVPASETRQQSASPRMELRQGYAPMRAQQPLESLHSTYGNQAVLRMLSQSAAPAVQAKLTVNQPGDVFEQEADRMADQVMRMPAPAAVQRQCASCQEEDKVQRKCAECEEEQKKTELQRKETGADPQFAPPIVHDVLRSSGQPLDPATRAFMEPRFGHDFSAVRVHTDASAADSARAVNALAYTAGGHVVFGSNRYSPGTPEGKRLLAHELTHVVQSKPHLARDKANQPTPPAPNPPTSQPTPTPNTPAACTVPADAAKQIADQGIPAKVIASMKYAIGMGTIRAGKAIPLTDAIINQADAAIKAQFGSLLPSRSFSKGGSITKQTPDQTANARVPDEETARRIIRRVALRTSGDALTALCITDEDNSVLDSAVAVPVLTALTIDGVRNYEKSEIGGLTNFPTQAGALPKVTLPTESPNIGHIVVHEAMHFYVHDVYRQTAEAGQSRDLMMEGGAEFMARLVIMNQLPSDPNFQINYGTYAAEFTYVSKNFATFGGNFPLAYLQGRVDVIGVTPVQHKKEISQPGDPLEQEADRMADRIMGEPAGPIIQRQCASCAEEDKTGVQRKENATAPQFAPPSVHAVLNSPGRPLDPVTRAFMEPRFGYDFSQVRVHDNARAAESARAVNALAYTHGADIVFAAGHYSPVSPQGRHLLAHELTHVVQQSGRGQMSSSGAGPVSRSASPVIMRNPGPCEDKCKSNFQACTTSGKDGSQCEAELSVCLRGCPPPESEKPSEPPKKDAPAAPAPAPAAKQAVSGTDSTGQGYVVYENEIRVGGTRPWRNNNPGNFDKPGDHPKNIGTDGRFLIFPDSATGKQELIDSIKAHGTSSIETFITMHAPPSENDTKGYIDDVLSFLNNGSAIGECQIKKPAKPAGKGTMLGDLSDADQSSFAMAMARKEGWCDVTQKKKIYNCQTGSIPDEYKGKLKCP